MGLSRCSPRFLSMRYAESYSMTWKSARKRNCPFRMEKAWQKLSVAELISKIWQGPQLWKKDVTQHLTPSGIKEAGTRFADLVLWLCKTEF